MLAESLLRRHALTKRPLHNLIGGERVSKVMESAARMRNARSHSCCGTPKSQVNGSFSYARNQRATNMKQLLRPEFATPES